MCVFRVVAEHLLLCVVGMSARCLYTCACAEAALCGVGRGRCGRIRKRLTLETPAVQSMMPLLMPKNMMAL